MDSVSSALTEAFSACVTSASLWRGGRTTREGAVGSVLGKAIFQDWGVGMCLGNREEGFKLKAVGEKIGVVFPCGEMDGRIVVEGGEFC